MVIGKDIFKNADKHIEDRILDCDINIACWVSELLDVVYDDSRESAIEFIKAIADNAECRGILYGLDDNERVAMYLKHIETIRVN